MKHQPKIALDSNNLTHDVPADHAASHGVLQPLLSPTLADDLYAELRQIAAAYFQRENRGHTLQPTAVAHEVYLRLATRNPSGWPSKDDFLAAASQAVRRVLTDHARTRNRKKRSGGLERTELNDAVLIGGDGRTDVLVLELDEAITLLAEIEPRCARVVELRYFGGLSVEEAAGVLGVSRQTVCTDWDFARAWLRRRLCDADPA